MRVDDPPTALLTCNDLSTIGTLRGLRGLGLRVPGDVSLVGFDDVIGGDLLDPPLTVIQQPVFEIGCRAIDVLIQRIADPAGPRIDIALPTRLVVRPRPHPAVGRPAWRCSTEELRLIDRGGGLGRHRRDRTRSHGRRNQPAMGPIQRRPNSMSLIKRKPLLALPILALVASACGTSTASSSPSQAATAAASPSASAARMPAPVPARRPRPAHPAARQPRTSAASLSTSSRSRDRRSPSHCSATRSSGSR